MPEPSIAAYFEAWNSGRTATLVDLFTAEGTYRDPTTPGPIRAAELAGRIAHLRAAFPDLRFDIDTSATADNGAHVTRWRMRGTNHGSFQGLPPTGKAIDLTGVDFIETEAGRIRSVQGYFDAGAVPRQLGLNIVVQPFALGPFEFGTSTRVAGRDATPGAVSITAIQAGSADQVEQIRNHTRATAASMQAMKGFIGLTTAFVGLRGMTVATWESAEDVAQLNHSPHAQAVRDFFATVGAGGWTSVWTTPKLNTRWIRCGTCTKMVAHPADGRCGCGAPLGAPVAWG